jgi:transposase
LRLPKSGCTATVLAIALANKLARIAWSVLAHGRSFEANKFSEAAAQSA